MESLLKKEKDGTIKRKTETRLGNLLKKVRKTNVTQTKAKEDRKKIHIRWKRFNHVKLEYSIVSHRHGGGYRYVYLEEEMNFGHLKSKAIELFFSNEGKCFYGEHVNDCTTSITDSSDIILSENQLIIDFLKNNGYYLSKIYFVLNSKTNNETINGVILNFPTIQSNCCFCGRPCVGEHCNNCFMLDQINNDSFLPALENQSLTTVFSGEDDQISTMIVPYAQNKLQPMAITATHSTNKKISTSTAVSTTAVLSTKSTALNCDTKKTSPSIATFDRNTRITTSSVIATTLNCDISITTISPITTINQNTRMTTSSTTKTMLSSDKSITSASASSNNILISAIATACDTESTTDPIIINLESNISAVDDDSISIRSNETVPYIAPDPPSRVFREKTITIHRMKLKDDMISAFKVINIEEPVKYEVIDARGYREEGLGVGVERDLYSAFWREISDSLCTGAFERVPFIRHDLYIDEWKSIGQILRRGYVDVGYFPIVLSQAFIVYCLFGSVPNDILIDSFLSFVSLMEKSILKEALKTTNPTIYDNEEFVDLLDRFGCRTRVHPLNVYGVVCELAQQELIQKPYIMVCSWKETLQFLRTHENFKNITNVKAFYNEVKPTTKKIMKLLSAELSTEADRCSFKYLQQYVRSLENSELIKLLRFLTGADIILCDKIQISFIAMDDNAGRRPIAHTCAPMLELPNTYRNFCELREEFQNILRVENWGTDCI